MEGRKQIVCGLSARGIRPPLPHEDAADDVEEITPAEVEVVEISDDDEDDLLELTEAEYMRHFGYFTRVEEAEKDIEPEFRKLLKRLQEKDKRLREHKFKALKRRIKHEEDESSKGKGHK